jgi:hypothetical protein
MTLMTIADTPHSIALGSAIGIFFGFTPLTSLKTLLSIGVAWACRCNKIAAAIAVTLHDVLLPFMPAIYLSEYKIGYRILHGVRAPRLRFRHIAVIDYLNWHAFVRVIWPTTIGSILLGVPSALIIYFLMRLLLSRAQTPPKIA